MIGLVSKVCSIRGLTHITWRVYRAQNRQLRRVLRSFFDQSSGSRHELKVSASLQITERSILKLGLKKFSRSFVLVHNWDRRRSRRAHAGA